MKLKIPKKREDWLFLAAKISSIGVFLVLFGAFSGLSVLGYYSYTVPAPDKLSNRKVAESTRIYDRNGILLYEVYSDEDRTMVALDYVSPYVVKATLAAEDADFYKHQGFDILGITRAAFLSLTGQGLQGGSTLTQQLVKNALLNAEQRIDRKIKELVLSLQIENKYNKDDILHWYLNETPYGSTAYGIESAAQYYFGKSSSELNLAESAYLAGLPQRPSYYSAFGPNPEAGINRQRYVLKLMHERGWIEKDGERKKLSDSEYNEAVDFELNFDQKISNIRAPHFVMYVLQNLYDKYGEEYVKSAGLKVTTTLDISKQEKVEQVVQEELAKADQQGLMVGNSAVLAIDPKNRNILTMVGSKDYFDAQGQFNVAISPTRQPGSSIKPLVYITALKQGYTPSTVIMDVPTTFKSTDGGPDYRPKNYDGTFRGPVQLRYALANSINITAVKMLKVVGLNSFFETTKDFGILSFDPNNRYYGLSVALGGGEASLLEMANAYAVFASGGYYQEPISVIKIEDRNGKDLNYNVDKPKQRVLEEGLAYLISSILSDNQARLWAFGPGNLLEFKDQEVAVKTGTTDDIKDNWTIGYTNDVVVGVWAGNNDNSPMNSRLASGVTGAAPIWNRAIKVFIDGKDNKFEKPDSVVQKSVGTITGGKPAGGLEEERIEYFIKGTEPEVRSEMVIELEVCEKDGKIANDECKDAGKSEKREYIKLAPLLPEWEESVRVWVEKNYPEDEDKYKKFYPPTKKSDWKEDDD